MTDFIQNTITDIFKAFPEVKECFYSFDKYSNTHFIRVESASVYESEEFAKLDAEISMKFYNLGVDGSLCLISPESQTDLTNPKSFLNRNILEESIVIEGIINYSIVDSFFYNTGYYDNILFQDLLNETFIPDNTIIYPLAA
jgi:hypothetical protein